MTPAKYIGVPLSFRVLRDRLADIECDLTVYEGRLMRRELDPEAYAPVSLRAIIRELSEERGRILGLLGLSVEAYS